MPRLPSFFFAAAGSPSCIASLDLLFSLAEAIFEGLYREVGLFLIDQERRRHANGVLARTEHQYSLVERLADHRIPQIGCLFLGLLIAHDFNADHQSLAAHIADNLEAAWPIVDAPENVAAHLASVLHVSAFDQVHRGHRRSDAYRVAAIRTAVRSRLPPHDAFLCDEGAQRHAAGNALRRAKNVRLDAGVFVGPPLSSASHARLHLVYDQHDPVAVADALQFLQKKCRRGDEPAFALNRLDNNRRDFLGCEEPLKHLLFEEFENFRAASFRRMAVRAAVRIRKWNMFHATEQGAEMLALGVLGSRE